MFSLVYVASTHSQYRTEHALMLSIYHVVPSCDSFETDTEDKLQNDDSTPIAVLRKEKYLFLRPIVNKYLFLNILI